MMLGAAASGTGSLGGWSWWVVLGDRFGLEALGAGASRAAGSKRRSSATVAPESDAELEVESLFNLC
jgi:hypothetical protein